MGEARSDLAGVHEVGVGACDVTRGVFPDVSRLTGAARWRSRQRRAYVATETPT